MANEHWPERMRLKYVVSYNRTLMYSIDDEFDDEFDVIITITSLNRIHYTI